MNKYQFQYQFSIKNMFVSKKKVKTQQNILNPFFFVLYFSFHIFP